MTDVSKITNDIITILGKNNKTLFTAESCTAGLVSASLADIPGASKVLLGGIVSYNNSIKESILNVNSTILEKYGAGSFECAIAMVKGALQISQADYVISITGIAGPEGGTLEKPIGTVYTAILSQDGGWSQKFLLEGNREEIRTQSVELVLKMLLATELEDDFFDLRLRDAREI